jgi:D-xylose transport system permease protein
MRIDTTRPSLQRLGAANAGVYYAFLVLVAVLSFLSQVTGRPPYLDPANVSNLLDQSSLVGLLVVFTTIVLISGNFDLSIGSTAALGACVFLIVVPDLGLWGALLVTLAAGGAVGLFNGLVVQKIGINAFIVTLGTLTAVRSLVLVLTDGRTITVADGPGAQALEDLDSGVWITPNVYLVLGVVLALVGGARWLAASRAGRPVRVTALATLGVGVLLVLASPWLIFTVALTRRTQYLVVIAAVAALVLRFTTVGRRLYAVGGNAEAARLSGIAVDRYKIVAFVLNGVAAAFVGSLYAARLGSINPTGLTGFELTALAAAILGGTSLFGGSGTILRGLVGVLILFTLRNGFNILNLGANWQGLIEGLVLIVAAGVYTVSGRRASRHVIGRSSSASGAAGPPAEVAAPPPVTAETR